MRQSTLFITALTLTFLTLLPGTAPAERATTEEMELVAQNWIDNLVSEKGDWAGDPAPEIAGMQEIRDNETGTLLGLCFSIAPSGHVVVPVLKEMAPVKSYSEIHTLDMEAGGGLPELLRDVLSNRAQIFIEVFGDLDVVQSERDRILFDPKQGAQWDRFAIAPALFGTGMRKNGEAPLAGAGPLLTSNWHQSAPYNNTCPMGDGGRTVVGCVATAAAMIMDYHEWPPYGVDSHSYYWNGDQSCGGSVGGGTQSAIFSDAYDWANIPNDCSGGCTTAEEVALAELCREVGVAFEMDYGVCGSGAYVSTALTIFPDYFRYAATIDQQNRVEHTASSWFEIIKTEIDADRPMQYRIDGHSIVCDGWRDISGFDEYHINYGWGGSHTAWYTLDNIYGSPNPLQEFLIRGIEPARESLEWIEMAGAGPLADGGSGMGVAWGDYDNDGDYDLYLANDGASNVLFRNDDETFIDLTDGDMGDAGDGRGVAWADYDNDGDIDLYLSNDGGANALLRNDGGNSFHDIADAVLGDAGNGRSAVWGDYDNDGDLDLYLVNDGTSNRLLRNDGSDTFRDLTAGPLGTLNSNAAAWGDYDNDGDLDLYIANSGSNQLLRNNGNDFTDVTSGDAGGASVSMGVAWGDHDNDGDLDIYIANDGSANRLLRNTGGGVFVDITSGPLGDTLDGRSVSWVDYDVDGDLDIYVGNSYNVNRLFRNDGSDTFANIATGGLVDSSASRGAAWADYDNDGDLDLYLANDGANRLYRCDLPNADGMLKHSIGVRLVGTASNRSSIGARVRIVTVDGVQIREISGGSGFLSENSFGVVFGVNTRTVIDSLIATWPSGVTQILTDIDADSTYTITELIAPDVTVTFPNGGEEFGTGTVRWIHWTNVEEPVTTFRVECSTNGGADWDSIGAGTDTGDHSVPWLVPNTPSTQCLARVLSENLIGSDIDTSDAFFSIIAVPIVTLTSPVGGETWEIGDTNDITWTNTGATATAHTILYSENDGETWNTLVDSLAGSGGGSFEWEIPDTPSLEALVQVVLFGANGEGRDTCDTTFRIAPAAYAGTQFTDRASGPSADTGNGSGAAWGDYNNDGNIDLYITNSGGANLLLENQGGSFMDATGNTGGETASFGSAWADYDNDGDIDLYIANEGANTFYRNDGGSFADATESPLNNSANGHATAWGDYNSDGEIDLYISNALDDNRLFRNEGDGSFIDDTNGLGMSGSRWGVEWVDYDGDTDLDLYAVKLGANSMFRNNGDGTFTDVSASPLSDPGSGYGTAWADYDNDGDFDVYLANHGANKLLRNEGGGVFTDVTTSPLDDDGDSYGAAWADYDNDGDLDLYLADEEYNKLFRNDGTGFVNIANEALRDAGVSRGAAWADYDNDGDLDLCVANEGANNLFRNDLSTGAHWFQARLEGTLSNRYAIGAMIRVVAGGVSMTRAVSGGSGYLSQNSPIAAFGLGSATTVDTVEVIWPIGTTQTLFSIPADTLIEITEPAPTWANATSGPLGDTGMGQGAAWGDYDGDGDIDIYLTNQGQANKLFRNDGGGEFTDVSAAPLNDASLGEGAAWGDYDNDGDIDLYLVNMGGANKLFRNDGMDDFYDATAGPLGDVGSGFSGTWGDYDNDGDIDLYVVNAGGSNRLLRNDEADGFFDATASPLDDAPGFGFTSSWGDYDNDGFLDIYVGNAYGANKMFHNEGDGSFTDATSGPLGDTRTTNAVAWGDYDNDGDLDLYLSNDSEGNRLLRNDAAVFVDVTTGALGDTGSDFGVAWVDHDNDGDLDLFIAQNGNNLLLENRGGLDFADVAGTDMTYAGSGAGTAWGDYDSDGDLDLYLPNLGGANTLLRNEQINGNHWLHIVLTGDTSNCSAIGARVRVVAGGIAQVREVSGGSGYVSQNSLSLEFGLGNATTIDSIQISWPGGSTQDTTGIAVDQVLLINEGGDITGVETAEDLPRAFALLPNAPNPFNPLTSIRFHIPNRGRIRVAIYDISGREVTTIADEVRNAGFFSETWNGTDHSGRDVGSGVYFVRMQAKGFHATRKMLLIR